MLNRSKIEKRVFLFANTPLLYSIFFLRGGGCTKIFEGGEGALGSALNAPLTGEFRSYYYFNLRLRSTVCRHWTVLDRKFRQIACTYLTLKQKFNCVSQLGSPSGQTILQDSYFITRFNGTPAQL